MNDHTERMRGKIPGPDTGIAIRKSICTICDPDSQCGLDLYVKNGKIIKVEGSKENPHNEGTLCSKGAALRQYVYHQDRIRTPLQRVGPRGSGKFKPVSWEEALGTITNNLNQVKTGSGPESVVFFSGYSFWYRPVLHRMAYLFGSPNIITNASVCHLSMIFSQILTLGLPGGPDIRNAKCLLVWGTNPFHTRTGIARHILDAKERGLKIIAVDPRCSPMAAQADIHLQLRPGTDGALALAMANIIINEGLFDHDFIQNYTHGFDEYREYVQEFTPERGEALTGVPAEKIRMAARLFADAKPAALMPGSSPVVHNTNGLQNHRAAFALVGLTGNYDVAGGNFVEPLSYIFEPGGFITRETEFKHAKKRNEMPPPIGDDRFPLWSLLYDEGHAVHLPFQIQSGTPYPIKAILAFGINYRMWPDPDFMAESLEKLDFIAISDLFMTESCRRFADIVLPACTSVERSEFRCYPERYVIYTQPAIKPLYESRPDVEIIFELAKRLALDDSLLSQGFEACLDWILEPSGITINELKKHPAGMPVPNPITFPEKKYLQQGFVTPSGKMEFKSMLLEKYSKSFGYDALPVYRPPKYSRETTPELAKDYPFILNTGTRLPMFIGSQTYRLPWMRNLRPEPFVDLNPDDCRRLGIKQGDDVAVSTAKGSITVKANLTNQVQPGVVHVSPAYIDVKVNALIEADYLDPISGFPGYKALLCKVEKTNDKNDKKK
ncbi:MAG: molybdopterin oxidoreductase family protein [Deltaproteobacteria bacterium]|nr:molybdopterin oxidoreductase family protein [Deltaproteobacteria bacterium]